MRFTDEPEIRILTYHYNNGKDITYTPQYRDYVLRVFNRIIFNGFWRNLNATHDSYTTTPSSYGSMDGAKQAIIEFLNAGNGIKDITMLEVTKGREVYRVSAK